LKCRVVQSGNVGFGFELNLCDREYSADLFDFDSGFRVYPRGYELNSRKLRSQRHCEAAGVSGAEQLFGVGRGFSLFKP
jgi:hypothetical protein